MAVYAEEIALALELITEFGGAVTFSEPGVVGTFGGFAAVVPFEGQIASQRPNSQRALIAASGMTGKPREGHLMTDAASLVWVLKAGEALAPNAVEVILYDFEVTRWPEQRF